MKKMLLFFIYMLGFSFLITEINAQCDCTNVVFNEISYDNTGADTEEYVEIFFPNNVTLTDCEVQHVNQSQSLQWAVDISGTYSAGDYIVIGSTNVTGRDFTIPTNCSDNCLQNGADDGIAIADVSSGLDVQCYFAWETADGTETYDGIDNIGIGSDFGGTCGTGAETSISLNPFNGEYVAGTCATPGAENQKDDGTVLPVELSNFTATPISENEIALSWTTASEEENDYFQIEKSRDGQKFEAIGKVKGAGNSLEQRTYQFVDDAAKTGVNYYRLAQFDYDGTMEYHQVVAVAMKSKDAKVEIYPTLVNEELNINLKGEATVSIMNISGALVKEVQVFDFTTVDVADLMTGTYFLVIKGESFVEALRIVKQ